MKIRVSSCQFGFMLRKGTTNSIFILRQIAEKYREKQKELYMAVIDLGKTVQKDTKSGVTVMEMPEGEENTRKNM